MNVNIGFDIYAGYDIMDDVSTKKQQVDLDAQLKATFTESGLTRFELAKRAGISYAIVHRYIGGDRTINLITASKLADVLGLELRPVKGK